MRHVEVFLYVRHHYKCTSALVILGTICNLIMSVSFGLKTSTPRKKAAPLAAFTETGAEDDEKETVRSELEKLAESERLQVRSHPSLTACLLLVLPCLIAQHQP